MRLRSSSVVLVWMLALACGDDASPDRDTCVAGTNESCDLGDGRIGTRTCSADFAWDPCTPMNPDAGLMVVADPAPPVIADVACERWRVGDVATPPYSCEPWPATGREDCLTTEVHVPGSDRCTRVSTPCPAGGEFPVVSDSMAVYVLNGAVGGDGTRAAPFGAVADAVTTVPPGGTVVVGAGTYPTALRLTGSLTVVGACAEQTRLVTDGSRTQIVQVEGGALTLRDVTIGPTGTIGLSVRGMGDAQVSGVVIEGVRDPLDVWNATLVLTRAHVANTLTGSLLTDATVEMSSVAFSGTSERALAARGGSLTLLDTSFFGNGSLGEHQAISLGDGQHMDADGLVIEENRGTGLLGTGSSSVSVRNLVIRDPRQPEVAVAMFDTGPPSTLERGRIEQMGMGFGLADGAAATLADLRFARLEANPDFPGRAVEAATGSVLTMDRVWIDLAREVGILAARVSRITATDVRVEETQAADRGLFGRGAQIQDGASLTGSRLVFHRNLEAAVVAANTARVDLVDAAIVDTEPRACEATTCAETATGAGAIAVGQGSIQLRRFSVAGSALCGVQITRDGQMDLYEGNVSSNGIGACFGDSYDVGRLMNDVIYRDNTVLLSTEALPIPDATVGQSL